MGQSLCPNSSGNEPGREVRASIDPPPIQGAATLSAPSSSADPMAGSGADSLSSWLAE